MFLFDKTAYHFINFNTIDAIVCDYNEQYFVFYDNELIKRIYDAKSFLEPIIPKNFWFINEEVDGEMNKLIARDDFDHLKWEQDRTFQYKKLWINVNRITSIRRFPSYIQNDMQYYFSIAFPKNEVKTTVSLEKLLPEREIELLLPQIMHHKIIGEI